MSTYIYPSTDNVSLFLSPSHRPTIRSPFYYGIIQIDNPFLYQLGMKHVFQIREFIGLEKYKNF